MLAHFTHRRRKTASTTVGDGGIETFISGFEYDFQDLFLLDGIADLDGAPGNIAGGDIHLHAGEGRTPKTVPPGSAADGDDEIAWFGRCPVAATRQEAQATAVDKGVGRVARMIVNGPVDGGNAHLVAIVLNAMDHAVGNATGVEDAFWERIFS